MSLPFILGWLGTAVTLGGYGVSTYYKNPRIFHIANVIGAVGVGVSALDAKAWPNLFLTASFGAIGLWGLLRGDA